MADELNEANWVAWNGLIQNILFYTHDAQEQWNPDYILALKHLIKDKKGSWDDDSIKNKILTYVVPKANWVAWNSLIQNIFFYTHDAQEQWSLENFVLALKRLVKDKKGSWTVDIIKNKILTHLRNPEATLASVTEFFQEDPPYKNYEYEQQPTQIANFKKLLNALHFIQDALDKLNKLPKDSYQAWLKGLVGLINQGGDDLSLALHFLNELPIRAYPMITNYINHVTYRNAESLAKIAQDYIPPNPSKTFAHSFAHFAEYTISEKREASFFQIPYFAMELRKLIRTNRNNFNEPHPNFDIEYKHNRENEADQINARFDTLLHESGLQCILPSLGLLKRFIPYLADIIRTIDPLTKDAYLEAVYRLKELRSLLVIILTEGEEIEESMGLHPNTLTNSLYALLEELYINSYRQIEKIKSSAEYLDEKADFMNRFPVRLGRTILGGDLSRVDVGAALTSSEGLETLLDNNAVEHLKNKRLFRLKQAEEELKSTLPLDATQRFFENLRNLSFKERTKAGWDLNKLDINLKQSLLKDYRHIQPFLAPKHPEIDVYLISALSAESRPRSTWDTLTSNHFAQVIKCEKTVQEAILQTQHQALFTIKTIKESAEIRQNQIYPNQPLNVDYQPARINLKIPASDMASNYRMLNIELEVQLEKLYQAKKALEENPESDILKSYFLLLGIEYSTKEEALMALDSQLDLWISATEAAQDKCMQKLEQAWDEEKIEVLGSHQKIHTLFHYIRESNISGRIQAVLQKDIPKNIKQYLDSSIAAELIADAPIIKRNTFFIKKNTNMYYELPLKINKNEIECVYLYKNLINTLYNLQNIFHLLEQLDNPDSPDWVRRKKESLQVILNSSYFIQLIDNLNEILASPLWGSFGGEIAKLFGPIWGFLKIIPSEVGNLGSLEGALKKLYEIPQQLENWSPIDEKNFDVVLDYEENAKALLVQLKTLPLKPKMLKEYLLAINTLNELVTQSCIKYDASIERTLINFPRDFILPILTSLDDLEFNFGYKPGEFSHHFLLKCENFYQSLIEKAPLSLQNKVKTIHSTFLYHERYIRECRRQPQEAQIPQNTSRIKYFQEELSIAQNNQQIALEEYKKDFANEYLENNIKTRFINFLGYHYGAAVFEQEKNEIFRQICIDLQNIDNDLDIDLEIAHRLDLIYENRRKLQNNQIKYEILIRFNKIYSILNNMLLDLDPIEETKSKKIQELQQKLKLQYQEDINNPMLIAHRFQNTFSHPECENILLHQETSSVMMFLKICIEEIFNFIFGYKTKAEKNYNSLTHEIRGVNIHYEANQEIQLPALAL